MNLRIESDSASGIVTLDGEIDLSSAPDLDRALAALGDRDLVTVDFGGVSLLDSSGIAVLMRALRRTAGTTIRLLQVSFTVRRTLEVSGVDRARGLEIMEATPSLRQCPCCGAALIRSPAWVPARLAGPFRPGDGYCPECAFVLTPELLDGHRSQLRCPTHAGSLFQPGVGPGAQSWWEVAAVAYGRNRRRWIHLRRENAQLRLDRRELMAELGTLRLGSTPVESMA